MRTKATTTISLSIIVILVCLLSWWMYRFAFSNKTNIANNSTNITNKAKPSVSLAKSVDLSIAYLNTLKIEVSVAENQNINRVEYSIDSKLAAVSYSSPFSTNLDISNLSPGEYTLKIIAYDTAGNASEPQEFKFTVAPPIKSPEETVYNKSAVHSSVYNYRDSSVTIKNPTPTVSPIYDTSKPSEPSSLNIVQSGEHDVTVSWNSSTDNVGIAGYQIWRDGAMIATAVSTNYVDHNTLPGMTYAYKILAYDLAGNLSNSNNGVSISLAYITIFTNSDTPPAISSNDPAGVNVGTRIRPTVNGYISGVRFYKNTDNTGTHTGNIWTTSGTNLGSVTFSNESSSGWQVAEFATPINVTAGTDYVVSYYAPNGNYSATPNFFGSSFFSSQYLVVPSAAETGPSGVYGYSGVPALPTNSFNSANYWIDATFTPSSVVSVPTSLKTCSDYPSFPDATCTGTHDGSPLITYNGVLNVTHDNTTLYNLDITGTISIRAKNVKIINSKIHGATPGVQVFSGDVAIYDSEMYNIDNAAILFDNWSGYNLNIHGMLGDGVKIGSDITLQDSYIHDFNPSSGAHSDGGQLQSGVGNVIIRHNTIDIPGGNSALFLSPDLGPNGYGPVLIDKNLLGGGAYTFVVVNGNYGQYHQSGYTITNNHFLRNFIYGPENINEPAASFILWNNNTWNDTHVILPGV